MGLLYCAGFQVGGSVAMGATFAGITVTVNDGLYMPGTLDTNNLDALSTWVGDHYTAFVDRMSAELAPDPTLSITWDVTTGLYTCAKSGGGTLSITFPGTAAGTALREALGFSGNKSGSASYVSDFLPAYEVESVISARTAHQAPLEPDDIAEESVSDGGDAFVVTRKTSEELWSWVQKAEPRAMIKERWRTGSGGVGWSWEKFFQHARGTHPVWCSDSLVGEVDGAFYRFTAEGASYRPTRETSDFDDLWIVPFSARWLAAWNP